MQRAGKIDNFLDRMFFGAQLDKIDIAVNHRFRDRFEIGDTHVTEIDNTAEPAIF